MCFAKSLVIAVAATCAMAIAVAPSWAGDSAAKEPLSGSALWFVCHCLPQAVPSGGSHCLGQAVAHTTTQLILRGNLESGFQALFNGRNLEGWEPCLSAPPGKREPIGPRRDPLGVFRVVQVDGEPAIRVSGEMYGGLATLKEQPYRFRPGGSKRVLGPQSMLNSHDNEKPRGQWNKLELYCLGQTSIHVVNGRVNLALSHIRRNVNGAEEPVTRGRIQLQSEGAEVYFRRMRLRSIREIPPETHREKD